MLVGEKIGPFDVEKELGSGAMGSVYRANYNRDGKQYKVALKVVALGLLGNEGALARFERESNILKQLKHPHIVRLIATGRYKGTPFIAMEYIDGEPLDRTLSRRGRFSWEEVARVGKQLCEALQYAHEQGIIHRDLKPSNLMVTKDGTLKLADFGIAKDSDMTALTGANSTIGTAAYMSPEQCRGEKDLTNKSDLYSLGIVFYELLTGKKPFTADTTVDMFLKHVNERPPNPAKFATEMPKKFSLLILQLLAKDRAERPVDAAWVGRYLAEIESDILNQQSAAEQMANARRVDLIGEDGTLTEDDKIAARAIKGKGGSARKKKARKDEDDGPPPPLLQRTWVKATALALALAAVLGVLAYVFWPASAESLYKTIQQAMEAKDYAAAEKAVKTYRDRFDGRNDEMTDKVNAIYRSLEVRRREAFLAVRFQRKMDKPEEADDPTAYQLTWDAMQAEAVGDLSKAQNVWGAVRARFPTAQEPPKAVWTWMAEKRIADIEEAKTKRPAAVREKMESNRRRELDPRYQPNDPEGLTVRGLRLEDIGEKYLAARTWDSLRAKTERNPDDHVWFLIAADRRAQYPKDLDGKKGAIDRGTVATTLLGKAKDALTDPKVPSKEAQERNARNIYRDVIELLDDEDATPEVKSAIAEADRQLKAMSKK